MSNCTPFTLSFGGGAGGLDEATGDTFWLRLDGINEMTGDVSWANGAVIDNAAVGVLTFGVGGTTAALSATGLNLNGTARYSADTEFFYVTGAGGGGNDFLGLSSNDHQVLWNNGGATNGQWTITNTATTIAYDHTKNTANNALFAMNGAGTVGIEFNGTPAAVQFGSRLGFTNPVFMTAGDGRKFRIPSNVLEPLQHDTYLAGEYLTAYDASGTFSDIVDREVLNDRVNALIAEINAAFPGTATPIT